MLAVDEPGVRDAQLTPDGRRLFILRGTRWVDHPDGSLERARQVFEQEEVKGQPLPEHLGGGYLFSAASGPGTDLWRSSTWAGELRPLGRVEPPVSQISPGFDRLYLASATSYTLRALDPETGQALDLAPLPLASSYGEMVFLDAWTGVVLAGVRGALASFDAGETWNPLGAPDAVNGVGLGPAGSISVTTDGARYQLDPGGHLITTGSTGSDALFEGAETLGRYGESAFPERPSSASVAAHPLGRRPLRAAVLRGWPDTPTSAVVIEAGAVGRVRLTDGVLLSHQPYSGVSPCRGVALGAGFGFVCAGPSGPTEIQAYVRDRVQPELRLEEAVRVRSSGNGALVIDAPCARVQRVTDAREPTAPERGAAQGGHYCVRQVSGELLDVHVTGDVGTERIAALGDGRVAVLIPPRSNAPGRLSLVTASGTSERELSLEPSTGPAARLARSGLWLDELWEVAPGQLGGWVVGAQAFVGVHVDLDGVVQLARLQDGVDETAFFGSHALQIAASASLRESDTHGFEWRVSEVPPVLLAAGLARTPQRPWRGCAPVGCVHDDWLRVGYGNVQEAQEPAHPEPPARVAFPAPGFAFWTLECRATGARARGNRGDAARAAPASGPDRGRGPAARPRSAGAVGEPPESSAWIQFQGVLPPARGAAEVGYDFGETNENGSYRAYAWGPGTTDWARRGRWQLRVGDRFSVDPPWTTLPSRAPWADAASAAQAFGLDTNTGVDWWLRLAATGDSGIVQIRVRSESSLHLIGRDRSITPLVAPGSSDLGALAAAYEVNDRWYLGASRAEQFQLYRVEQGKLDLLATYPLWGRISTQLIRSVQGDELALLQKSSGAGWYVVPIDLETFEPKPAFHVPNEVLGRVPARCEAGRPGWLAVSGVPLTDSAVSESNTHLDFVGGAAGLRTKRLTARVVLEEGGVCVDGLAALVDGAVGSEPKSNDVNTARAGLPLVVTDPADDRRWGFLCTP
jgi:hypothetical protein